MFAEVIAELPQAVPQYDSISQAINELAKVAIATIASLIAYFGISVLSRLRKKLGIDAKAGEEKLVEEAIERAVLSTMQSFVDEVKKEGELTRESASKALNMSRIEAQRQLGILASMDNKTAQMLNGDVKALLARIEAAIPVVKHKTNTGQLTTMTLEQATKAVAEEAGQAVVRDNNQP